MITKAGVAVPDDMATVLQHDPDAATKFAALRPGDQRKFVDWLAKPGAQSRSQRLAELGMHIQQHRAAAG